MAVSIPNEAEESKKYQQLLLADQEENHRCSRIDTPEDPVVCSSLGARRKETAREIRRMTDDRSFVIMRLYKDRIEAIADSKSTFTSPDGVQTANGTVQKLFLLGDRIYAAHGTNRVREQKLEEWIKEEEMEGKDPDAFLSRLQRDMGEMQAPCRFFSGWFRADGIPVFSNIAVKREGIEIQQQIMQTGHFGLPHVLYAGDKKYVDLFNTP